MFLVKIEVLVFILLRFWMNFFVYLVGFEVILSQVIFLNVEEVIVVVLVIDFFISWKVLIVVIVVLVISFSVVIRNLLMVIIDVLFFEILRSFVVKLFSIGIRVDVS